MADTKEITIQGVVVSVSQPYAEGHKITEAEAKALNQVRAENIANNKRKQIKEMLEAEGATAEGIQSDAQSIVAEYDKEYEFTLASVGGGSTRLDPLTKECRKIAREYIVGQIKKAGLTLKDYADKNGPDALKEKVVEIQDHPEVVKLAKKALKEREAMASLAL